MLLATVWRSFVSCPRTVLALASLVAAGVAPAADLVIRDATVMTVSHGTIDHGSVWIHDGKIAGVGTSVNAPESAIMLDASGKYVTPGIVDPHSHSSFGSDVNEATNPITPGLLMLDAFKAEDKTFYLALAGGVTTEMLLHGSTNVIGGQAVVIKNKFGLSRDAMLFPKAPRSIKFATGENPKRTYGSRDETPSTRMGDFEVMREAFEEARVYRRDWDNYDASVLRGDTNVTVPQRDLKLEALADILRGKLLVQIHVYRSDEMLTELEIAKEYGYKIRAFHHALEAYKIADKIAASGVAIATFADWYGYKEESWDAIPWNAVLCMRKGVRVALKSDSADHIRRLNQEAGKMVRYGGATEEEALRMITLNPAWIIGVEDRVGSLDSGKDADIVIWNHDPLSVYARVEKVYIDGELFFDSAAPGLGATQFQGVMTDASRSGSDE
jgi:imidazolonepropionase-like amidohydrolase